MSTDTKLLAYELMAIAVEADAGNGFDVVCRKTLQRVIDALLESDTTKLLAAQARIKMLRKALESIKNFSPAGDWPDEFAVLATPDDTAELDELIADAERWRSHIAAMHALMKPGHGSHEANCERKEKP